MATDRLMLAQNVSNGAVTQLQGYNFSSMARVGRNFFGANEDGLYQIGGDDFAGTPIQGYCEFYMDFGEPVRCASLWLGVKADSTMEVQVTTDDRTTKTYTASRVPDQLLSLEHGMRVFLQPHTDKGQFVRIRVGNASDGGDFKLDVVDLTAIPLGGQRTGT